MRARHPLPLATVPRKQHIARTQHNTRRPKTAHAHTQSHIQMQTYIGIQKHVRTHTLTHGSIDKIEAWYVSCMRKPTTYGFCSCVRARHSVLHGLEHNRANHPPTYILRPPRMICTRMYLFECIPATNACPSFSYCVHTSIATIYQMSRIRVCMFVRAFFFLLL